MWLVKHGPKLVLSSVLFDVVYGLTYVTGFVLLGEVVKPTELAGAVLALLGLVLVAM